MQKMYMIEAHTGCWEDTVDVILFACFTIEELNSTMETFQREVQAFYNQMKYNTYHGCDEMFGIDTTYVLANMVSRAVYNNFLTLRTLSIDVGVANAPVQINEPVYIELHPYGYGPINDIDMDDDLSYNKYEAMGEAIEARFR